MKLYEYLKKIIFEQKEVTDKNTEKIETIEDIENISKIKERLTNIKNNITDINFINPKYETEVSEIERIVKEFELNEKQTDEIKKQFENPKLVDFKSKKLDNSDYLNVKTFDDIVELANKYGKDINRLLKQFEKGEIEAPIVLFRAKKNPYLIGGNTRLMLLKVLNIKPKVLQIKI